MGCKRSGFRFWRRGPAPSGSQAPITQSGSGRRLVVARLNLRHRGRLSGTPERVARAYKEFFAGYAEDPVALLAATFEKTAAYDEMIVLRDIRIESHCEHHLVPILGKAHVGYLPAERIVGISKLARAVEVFAKRMQIQEVLKPRGVGVVIEAAHQCMTTRGIREPGVSLVTSLMLGCFRDDPTTRREFLSMFGARGSAPHGS